jgi:sec-independent protein translocase protein TatA
MLGKFEELLVILVIILVLFGGKKLPELARSIGTSVREVRKGFAGEDVDKTSKIAKNNVQDKPTKSV